jgi:hypothetical protein
MKIRGIKLNNKKHLTSPNKLINTQLNNPAVNWGAQQSIKVEKAINSLLKHKNKDELYELIENNKKPSNEFWNILVELVINYGDVAYFENARNKILLHMMNSTSREELREAFANDQTISEAINSNSFEKNVDMEFDYEMLMCPTYTNHLRVLAQAHCWKKNIPLLWNELGIPETGKEKIMSEKLAKFSKKISHPLIREWW